MAEKIEPRHGCLAYVTQQKVSMEREDGKTPAVELITKAVFDELLKEGKFTDGPFLDSFGDGYGDYYYPWRQIYGTVREGENRRIVYSEIHKSMQTRIAAQLQPSR